MSPRAACRLDTLGCKEIYDYMPSKADWMARGLPMEEEKASEPRAIDIARMDVVTCGLQDTIGAVHDRVTQFPYGFAFVLGPGEVLLGRLRKAPLENNPDAKAQDARRGFHIPSSAVGGHSGAGFGVYRPCSRGFEVGTNRIVWAHT
jgi:hypothetical protein